MEAPADYLDGVYFVGDVDMARRNNADADAEAAGDAASIQDAAAAAGAAEAPQVPPLADSQQPILGPVDKSAWLYTRQRLTAEQLDGTLEDDIDDSYDDDTTYCFLCHAHNDSSNDVAIELQQMIQSYRLVKPQMLLRVLQAFYNLRARASTGKNWRIDQINAHIHSHVIDHGIQVADDIRQLNAVADYLGDKLVAKSADGTPLPSSRSELRTWFDLKKLKLQYLARLTVDAGSGTGGSAAGRG